MAYSADSFVADEQPTTAKWNKLWTNDASFNDGTGIADDAIIARHMADNSVLSASLNVISTTDANGWSVYDFGSTTIYAKRVTFSQTFGGGAVGLTLSSSTLPSGMSSISTNKILVGAPMVGGNGAQFGFGLDMTTASTSLVIAAKSTDGVSRAWAGSFDIIIISG